MKKIQWLVVVILGLFLIMAGLMVNPVRAGGYGVILIGIAFLMVRKVLNSKEGLLILLTFSLGLIGWALDLYNQVGAYDKILHFLNPLIITYSVALLLNRMIPSRMLIVLLAIAVGISLGAIWEIIEWLASRWTTYPPNTLSDTITDLLLNVIGSVVASLMQFAQMGDGYKTNY